MNWFVNVITRANFEWSCYFDGIENQDIFQATADVRD